jgi:hypothetical protein
VGHRASGAESKDPGGAYITHAAWSFSTAEAREQDLLQYALVGHGYILSTHHSALTTKNSYFPIEMLFGSALEEVRWFVNLASAGNGER